MNLHRIFLAAAASIAMTACSSSAPPPPAPAAKAPATAAPVNEAAAAKEQALYDQMRASQSWDLAVSLGEEIVNKYPASTAAGQVRQTLDEVRGKAKAQRESRRLAKLWAYAAVPEAGGTQYTAAVESKEPLKAGATAKEAERIRLVLRDNKGNPFSGHSVLFQFDGDGLLVPSASSTYVGPIQTGLVMATGSDGTAFVVYVAGLGIRTVRIFVRPYGTDTTYTWERSVEILQQ